MWTGMFITQRLLLQSEAHSRQLGDLEAGGGGWGRGAGDLHATYLLLGLPTLASVPSICGSLKGLILSLGCPKIHSVL